MAEDKTDWDGNLSPADMKIWLRQEVARVNIAAKRRIEEAAAFVEAYATGNLSADEADERQRVYLSRWPDRFSRNENLEKAIEDAAEKTAGAKGEGRSRG